jgi:lipase chaperone LimK
MKRLTYDLERLAIGAGQFRNAESACSASTSIRQAQRKALFALLKRLTYDLERLAIRAGQHLNAESACRVRKDRLSSPHPYVFADLTRTVRALDKHKTNKRGNPKSHKTLLFWDCLFLFIFKALTFYVLHVLNIKY